MSKGAMPMVLALTIIGFTSAGYVMVHVFPSIANSLAGAQEAGTAQQQAEKLADEINTVCENSFLNRNTVELEVSEDYSLQVDQKAGNKEVELRNDEGVIQETYELSECEGHNIVEAEVESGSYEIIEDDEGSIKVR